MPKPLYECASPHLPPIRIDLSDIPIDYTDEQYLHARSAVEAYWKQAYNMTKVEQMEYQQLIKEELYKKEGKLVTRPSDHNVYRACRKKPNWARFIFIHAIYDALELLDRHLLEEHHYTSVD
ncbi:hypothetical protein N5P37_004968 [Trichoderma harzianum]|uniref:Uncharacterized protein n=1 Tax=Trichoderma harzianum CBS 226.95 TaxID=983964 RepID=A0A2T4ADF5_TRIHA|nr:hypothetical protein M431DRAFT_5697 [Trichoderma harzianum CBS 226.95]KAK0762165.1 hypothetical protein N5P37_004968 [Trichoderma harzianum]PKK41902.1 hypothetical protein CI102_14285 [Trichoderma harzianum]PTB55109.1 hypothetical protein M431DRAFT_5697 [Trichoderma harzianum CBS 226.95]